MEEAEPVIFSGTRAALKMEKKDNKKRREKGEVVELKKSKEKSEWRQELIVLPGLARRLEEKKMVKLSVAVDVRSP